MVLTWLQLLTFTCVVLTSLHLSTFTWHSPVWNLPGYKCRHSPVWYLPGATCVVITWLHMSTFTCMVLTWLHLCGAHLVTPVWCLPGYTCVVLICLHLCGAYLFTPVDIHLCGTYLVTPVEVSVWLTHALYTSTGLVLILKFLSSITSIIRGFSISLREFCPLWFLKKSKNKKYNQWLINMFNNILSNFSKYKYFIFH